jgi:predicted phage terminase large subunit-like protein
VFPISAQLSKEERASRALPFLQKKQVRIPKQAPWLSTWENEVFSFPSTMYDDQTDTLVYFALQAIRGFRNYGSIEWFQRPLVGRLVSYS